MRTEIALAESRALAANETKEFATIEIGGQLIGIPVLEVQDVLNPSQITPIPLSRNEVAGLLNLRGRIVTAIDIRTRLGLPRHQHPEKCMSVVVEQHGELYSLVVDKVGDVMKLPLSMYESSPPNLDPVWANVSEGVFRLEDRILIVANIKKLLDYSVE